jgi:hypothetical protein
VKKFIFLIAGGVLVYFLLRKKTIAAGSPTTAPGVSTNLGDFGAPPVT